MSFNPPFTFHRLPEPLLMFYNRVKHTNPKVGLQRWGPYDLYNFSSKSIKIGLITTHRLRKYSTNFLNEFISFSKRILNIKNIYIEGEEFVDDADDILQKIEDSYQRLLLGMSGKDSNVVFIILDDEVVERYYWRLKTLRFKHSTLGTMRTQIVKEGRLRNMLSDKEVQELELMNLLSAIYAKAGGTPWVLDEELMPTGVIMGIAFSKSKIVPVDSSNKVLFYYGIITIYNKFGMLKHMMVRAIQREFHAQHIKGLYIPKESMIKILTSVYNVYKPPIVVIHKSGRFHKDELEAIKEVLGRKDVKYALIHVESSNIYRGFGESRTNANPVRGDIIIDKEINRAILFTTGCVQSGNDIRPRKRTGTPKPLELEVEENKTHYNIKDLAMQILKLTKLDWNTTEVEVRAPITIKYARKIAKMASLLSQLNQNPDANIDIRDLM